MHTPSYLTLSRDNDLTASVFLSSEHGLDPTGKTVSAALYLNKAGDVISDPDTTATVTELTDTPATRRQYRIAIDSTVVNELLDDNPTVTVYWMRVAEATGTTRWVKVVVDAYPEIT